MDGILEGSYKYKLLIDNMSDRTHNITAMHFAKHHVLFTKASEASWSYSPPPSSPLPTSPLPTSPLPTSPPLLLLVFLPSSLPPSSLLPLRKFDSVLSSLFGMRLALRILRPHSLTLTLTLSLSHCLTVSLISLISLISFSSLSSLSPLSLSLLSVSRLSVSLLSLLSQEDPGKEPHIKDSSPLPPKRAPCFFLPRCPPLSHSGALAFAPPLASSECFDIFPNRLCLRLPAYVSFLWGCLFQRWQLVFQAKLLPYPALQSLPTPWPRCQDIRDFGWHYFKLREFGIP